MGHHFARQDSSLDPGSSSTSSGSPDAGGSSTPASTSIDGSSSSLPSASDAGATSLSPSSIATASGFSATGSAATTLGTTPGNSNINTAAVASSTPNSSAPPTSQPTLSSSSQQGNSFSVTSNSAPSASVSASISTSATDSASASLTSSSLTPSASGSSSIVSSSSSPSSSTTESTSSSSHSSTRSSTNSRSTSLTTSYTEVISTVDGQITTIFSPVATLSAETSLTTTSSNRTAIIAGVTAGCAALIILVLLGVFMYRRRQKRRGDQSHGYLPTPRSVMLSGEDDLDLAGGPQQQPQRGIAIFASRRKKRGGEQYGNLVSESEGEATSHPPVMREVPSEPPPRLLRPVASKTGSYFQEAVWPPPDEGSRLSDPLMAASHVNLHGIVEEVMGPSSSCERGPSRIDAERSSSSSPPPASRLRGGAADRSSFLSGDSGVFTEFVPHIPQRREDSPSMYSMESGFGGESPLLQHARDWSADSSTGLLARMEGGGASPRGTKRSGGSGGTWLPPGAAPPALLYGYGRPTSPPSPLRVVTEPSHNSSILPSARIRGKVNEAAQGHRSSTRMAVVNPSPDEEVNENENASTSVHAPSYSVSLSSTQRLRRPADMLETTREEMATPCPDESLIDRPSVAHNKWLLDTDAEEEEGVTGHGQAPTKPRDEIPPRYDMIRRDSYSEEEDGLVKPTTRITTTTS